MLVWQSTKEMAHSLNFTFLFHHAKKIAPSIDEATDFLIGGIDGDDRTRGTDEISVVLIRPPLLLENRALLALAVILSRDIKAVGGNQLIEQRLAAVEVHR